MLPGYHEVCIPVTNFKHWRTNVFYYKQHNNPDEKFFILYEWIEIQ